MIIMALQDLKFVQKDELVARVTEILGAKSKNRAKIVIFFEKNLLI